MSDAPNLRPPSPERTLVAAAVALLAAVGAVAAPRFARAAVASYDFDQARSRLIGEALGLMAGSLAWDATLGAALPASAVVLTAAMFRAPCRSLPRVFLGLWGAYATVNIAITLGLILVVPGVLVAVVAFGFADPVARAEGRGIGVTVPRPIRALLLALTLAAWIAVSSAVQFGSIFLHDYGWGAELGALFGYQVFQLGAYLGWFAILRRTRAFAAR